MRLVYDISRYMYTSRLEDIGVALREPFKKKNVCRHFFRQCVSTFFFLNRLEDIGVALRAAV